MEHVQYLNVPEALTIYAEVIRASRVNRPGVRNLAGLESALAQPQQTFDGNDLYPTLEEKAAALLYSLCQNHPFTDGNKRVAFIAARSFLRRNGYDIEVETDEVVEIMTAVAQGDSTIEKIGAWLRRRLREGQFSRVQE